MLRTVSCAVSRPLNISPMMLDVVELFLRRLKEAYCLSLRHGGWGLACSRSLVSRGGRYRLPQGHSDSIGQTRACTVGWHFRHT